jgi:outer membrane biosynthesis protein TonB
MKHNSIARTLLIALPVGMLVGIAGSVLAADPKFDEANGHIEKAIKALEAVDSKGKRMPYGGHRLSALEHLRKAQRDIGKAKDFEDRHAKKDAGKPDAKPEPDPKPEPKPDPKPDPNPKSPKSGKGKKY